MFASLVAALIVSGAPIPEKQPSDAPLEKSTVCSSGGSRDHIQIRVFPIHTERRVFPSPEEIMAKGGRSFVLRAFWEGAMAALCQPGLPTEEASSRAFLPRIVVFVEGEEGREPLLLEYPDWRDNPAPVRARVNGKMVAVPAAVVRRLLDYAREGWRE